jgi:hypothetical protein
VIDLFFTIFLRKFGEALLGFPKEESKKRWEKKSDPPGGPPRAFKAIPIADSVQK